jgi:hypothetical protein
MLPLYGIVVSIFIVRKCCLERNFGIYPLKTIELMVWIFQEVAYERKYEMEKVYCNSRTRNL